MPARRGHSSPPRTAAARAWSRTPGLTTTERVLTASTGA